ICDICNKIFNGKIIYSQHLQSNKHLKNEMKNYGNSSLEEEEIYQCDICVKVFSGPIPFRQHLFSSAHIKEELKRNKRKEDYESRCIRAEDQPEECSAGKATNETRSEENIEGCDLCGIFKFTNLQSLIQHLNTEDHIKKKYMKLN
ncbi:uncharacterized protein LOC111613089, partial [Centruroides sculpturatus]|uniref:uncharacterized protein LOC111613089 n=1 Tax=Centruroides sculpturatus TaxID=218467 RepID=UPI000C6C9875